MSILDSLKLEDINKLFLHETYEPSRVEKTIEEIRRDGFLRHPVIVTKMKADEYLVLDGVHRVTALKKLGMTNVPIQIVEKGDFSFNSWHHLVSSDNWYKELIHRYAFFSSDNENPKLSVEIINDEGEKTFIQIGGKEEYVLKVWHSIVSSYTKSNIVISRVLPGEYQEIEKGKILVKYSSFTYETIHKLVKKGNLLPAGVTRVKVNERLLNLKIPLKILSQYNHHEESWLAFLNKKEESLRLYTERVYLCEL
ncbi:ParB N-terminal domain-containing protein [Bacillus cereus]|uniref:ParB N-terminal domain-containing protein n=1 Tax=Bacillus cereus TaxID=1396 RepID=UPI003CFE6DBF